ncbi:hypothetical protein GW17_00000003 [Ensete ventricosum]|nr:hypothetical protein GW17_00000003 [Ensete ventricosum]
MTIVTTEQQANDLQAKVERLKSNLREAERQHRELQQGAYDLHGHLRDSQRKLKKLGLQRSGQVPNEYEYRVALA